MQHFLRFALLGNDGVGDAEDWTRSKLNAVVPSLPPTHAKGPAISALKFFL
jgi:hypothetical protein